MAITEKTKVSLSIPQWFALFGLIFSVGGGFAVVNGKSTEALEAAEKNCADIEQIKRENQMEREKVFKLIQDVRESQIRIEGKLDLKQDKYAK